MRYDERKAIFWSISIYEFLEFSLGEEAEEISEELRSKLTRLRRVIDRLLRS